MRSLFLCLALMIAHRLIQPSGSLNKQIKLSWRRQHLALSWTWTTSLVATAGRGGFGYYSYITSYTYSVEWKWLERLERLITQNILTCEPRSHRWSPLFPLTLAHSAFLISVGTIPVFTTNLLLCDQHHFLLPQWPSKTTAFFFSMLCAERDADLSLNFPLLIWAIH